MATIFQLCVKMTCHLKEGISHSKTWMLWNERETKNQYNIMGYDFG